jgi:hypothetical protein
MRHQRVVLLALALFSAASAQAASLSTEPAFQRLTVEQLYTVQGDYQLSNGHRITLTEFNGRLYAMLGKRDRRELLATGEHSFSTRDRTLNLRFEPNADSDQIVLTGADSTDRSLAQAFSDAQRNLQASLSMHRQR